MAFQAGAIVSKLTLDRSKFSASIKTVQKQTKKLGSWVKKNSAQFKRMGIAATVAGTAALVVFTKMVKKYVEMGDMIHKMSIRTGFAAETLSELAFAADISGADITMLEKGVKKMAKTISDADRGMATYIDAFKAIGLEVKDLMDLSPEDQFMKIGLAIAELEHASLRTAAAVDIFGRAGTMLLPLFAEGSEGIKALGEEAHRVGIIFDKEMSAKAAKLADAQRTLKGSIQGVSIAILNDLIPVITDVTKGFTEWFVDTRADAKTWAVGIIKFFKVILKGIKGLSTAFVSFRLMTFEAGAGIAGMGKKSLTWLEKIMKENDKWRKRAKENEKARQRLIRISENLGAVEESYRKEVEKSAETINNINKEFDDLILSLDSVGKGLKTVKKETKDVVAPIAKALIPLTRDLKLGAISFDIPKMSAKDFAEWYKDWLANLMADWPKTWLESFQLVLQDAAMFTSALSGLFSQMTENQIVNIEREYEARKKAIDGSLMTEKSKNDAIEKLDKEFEKRRLKAMRTQAKRTKVVGIMESMINTFVGITAALKTANIPLAIAIGTMGAVQTALIAATPLPALAEGGRLGKGQVGIVGEEGPELFAPDTGGTIIPMREGAGLAGLRPIYLTIAPSYQISAIDEIGVDEFMRNRGLPAMVEAIKIGIMKPELQDILRIK